jgi:hypothetical protein
MTSEIKVPNDAQESIYIDSSQLKIGDSFTIINKGEHSIDLDISSRNLCFTIPAAHKDNRYEIVGENGYKIYSNKGWLIGKVKHGNATVVILPTLICGYKYYVVDTLRYKIRKLINKLLKLK